MPVVRVAVAVAAILVASCLPALSPGAATRVSGEAYALAIGVPATPVTGWPAVSLPAAGGTASDVSPEGGLVNVGGISGAGRLSVSTSGVLTDLVAGATSTAAVASVELLTGVVRATDVQAWASSTKGNGRADSDGAVTFGSLTVAGLSYPNPRPNERVELPGVGYVVLNEQLVGGDGVTTSSVIVRALHLHVTVPTVLGLPRLTELIVAGVSTGIPDVDVSRLVDGGSPSRHE